LVFRLTGKDQPEELGLYVLFYRYIKQMSKFLSCTKNELFKKKFSWPKEISKGKLIVKKFALSLRKLKNTQM